MIKPSRRSTMGFVWLSLALHICIVLSMWLGSRLRPPPPEAPLEIDYISADELEPDDDQKVKREKTEQRDQIVEQKDQINEEVDVNTRFLSAFNQKVIKQTIAERSGAFVNTAEGGQPDEGKKDGDKQAENTDDKPTKKNRKDGELPDLKDLTPKFSLTPGPKAASKDKNGNPSESDDYVNDVKSGLQTLLSTREFVYYAYYSRIKDALRQHWEPTVREKVKIIYRQGRSIASARDRVTQVMVTLNSKGDLIRVEVLTQSGVTALDAAAVEAFQAAAPFPNPPKGMVEQDGTIKIRWDFVLEA